MRSNLLAFGWLFVAMGIALGGLTSLDLLGIVEVPITISGHQLESIGERRGFLAVWIGATIIGFGLLLSAWRITPRSTQSKDSPGI